MNKRKPYIGLPEGLDNSPLIHDHSAMVTASWVNAGSRQGGAPQSQLALTILKATRWPVPVQCAIIRSARPAPQAEADM
jgi:hypothetical protein